MIHANRAGRSATRRWRDFLPEILFLTTATAAGLLARGRWLDPIGDTGIWWSMLHRLMSGERLYRDVFIQYGPLSPYVLALGARVFGLSATYLLIAGWIAAMLCGLLMLRLAGRLLSNLERVAVAALMLSLSLFAPGVNPLVLAYAPAAVHGLLLSLVALLVVDGEGAAAKASWRPFGAGVAAGLAFAAKPEIGIAAILSVAAYLAIGRAPALRLAAAVLGFAVPAALALAFILGSAPTRADLLRSHVWPLASGVPEPWRNLFRILMGVTSPDWALLVRGSAWTLLAIVALLAAVGLLAARERSRRGWTPLALLAAVLAVWGAFEGYLLVGRFWPTSLSMIVSVAVGAWALLDRRLPARQRALIAAVALFAAMNGVRSAFSTSLFSPYDKVSQFAASLTWVLFACRLVPAVLGASAASRGAVRTVMAVSLAAVSVWTAARSVSHLSPPGVVPYATRGGTVYVAPGMREFLSRIGSETRPGEEVAVLPEINGVDAFFALRDPSPWLTHVPGWLDADAESVLIDRFGRIEPRVIVLFDRSTWLFRTAPFGRGYGRSLAAWIDGHYAPTWKAPEGTIYRLSSPPGRLEPPGAAAARPYNPKP